MSRLSLARPGTALLSATILLSLGALGACLQGVRTLPARAADPREALVKLPLSFEENRGQGTPEARFLSRGPGYQLALSATEAVLSQRREARGERREVAGAVGSRQGQSAASIRMRMVGGNAQARVRGVEKQRGVVNYLIGNDRKKWRTRIPTYAKVEYEAVYPGVDLVYHGTQGSLEYDFVVAPGADPKQIRLSFAGAEKTELAPSGNLVLHTPTGALTQHKPVAYQVIDGRRVEVPATFALDPSSVIRHPLGNHAPAGDAPRITDDGSQSAIVSFELARYDATAPLVIDPTLHFSSYVGGGSGDSVNAVALGSDGAAYLAGTTDSTDFPVSGSPYQGTSGGGTDVFVTKIAADRTLAYSTYVGGTGSDLGNGIAIDSSGLAYVAGTTGSTDFPTAGPAYQGANAGGTDAMVFKLSAAGDALPGSTYYGGTGNDTGSAIALASGGIPYLVGGTFSADLANADVGFPAAGAQDAFFTQFTANLTGAIYGRYLGGTGSESATGVAVDASGAAYICGSTGSSDFPVTTSFDTSYNGSGDAFVTKLDLGGGTVAYSTYLGGTDEDFARAIAVDSTGQAYVTGESASSTDFPLDGWFWYLYGGGSYDAYLTCLSADGSDTEASTFLGGTGTDIGTGVAVDSTDLAYVVGSTTSADLPLQHAYSGELGGSSDAFLVEFDPNATTDLAMSTYYGGSDGESGYAVAVGSKIWLAGETVSTDLPLFPAPIDGTAAGSSEGFVAALDPTGVVLNLSLATGSNGKPELTWDFGSEGVHTTYHIQRRAVGATSFADALTTGFGQRTNIEDTTATPGVHYYYRVSNGSDITNTELFSPELPAAPSNLNAATNLVGDEVTLTWTDNSNNETGFAIYRWDGTSWVPFSSVGAGVTTFTDTTTNPSLYYHYQVAATNERGESDSVEAVSSPFPPSDLTATARSENRITLSWTDNADLDEDGFEIQAKRGAGSYATIARVLPIYTTYDDTELAPNTTYTYRVRSFGGSYSPWDGPASATTDGDKPEAPSNLTVFSPDRGHVNLTWMDNSDDEDGFRIYRRVGSSGGYSLLTTTAADANTYADATTTGDTEYSYSVVAYNDHGASKSTKEESVTTLWGPELLTTTPVTTGQIDLTWKDLSLYEDGYSIERRKGGGTFLEVARVSGKVGKNQTLTYSDTGLTSGITYLYRIRAYNSNATSLYSSLGSVVTTGAPEPSLRITPVKTSFGRVARGQARTATFTVKNAGKKWEAVTLGALGGAFRVVGNRHLTIPVGQSRSFKVRFEAGKVGAYQAELPVKCQHGEVVKLKLDGRSIRG
jgi:hypothetical protein